MVNDKSDKLPFLLQLISLNYPTMHRKCNAIEYISFSFSFFFYFVFLVSVCKLLC